jgi:hypothetical protein
VADLFGDGCGDVEGDGELLELAFWVEIGLAELLGDPGEMDGVVSLGDADELAV